MTTTNLSYPIGQCMIPDSMPQEYLTQCIAEIADLPKQMRAATQALNDAQLDTPYRPEGWTVRQLVHHVADSHMNSYVRFHWTLTEPTPTIKAYDEKAWAALDYHQTMPIEVSLQLLDALHQRWVVLLRALTPNDLHKAFVHPATQQQVSLREAVATYAWHGKHHVAHVASLRTRMGW
ncbi:YfiT family bacillithiol transferase [uncultured Microscilla sp.]|uniref:YfiT family bacillithiol transferase n=1 Tax=uncultured Microscilla sp. TaxID=432653 RepID=UPI0026207B90|nr:putative metal-dependent hydrolase [uncultured Microscilla sp.]